MCMCSYHCFSMMPLTKQGAKDRWKRENIPFGFLELKKHILQHLQVHYSTSVDATEVTSLDCEYARLSLVGVLLLAFSAFYSRLSY